MFIVQTGAPYLLSAAGYMLTSAVQMQLPVVPWDGGEGYCPGGIHMDGVQPAYDQGEGVDVDWRTWPDRFGVAVLHPSAL